jgi:uncharacterized protein YndB with AHSA1/START domain
MTTNPTQITADPERPPITVVREYDAPRDQVYRAWIDPTLVAQWLGPKDTQMNIDTWDARTGGSWRYSSAGEDGQTYGFFGSFHELRPNERLVQTFTFEGWPDSVCLETMTFEELEGGRTRVVGLSVYETKDARDGMLASGMETGVVEGYERLDDLLAQG